MLKLPTLYKKTAGGAIQQWTIEVCCPEDLQHCAPAQIIITYGQVGGKMQTADELVDEGKNLGKKNETTPYQQACSQAESAWLLQKKKKGYVDSIAQAEAGEVDAVIAGGLLPMLAEKFMKDRKLTSFALKMVYPALAQPKLDGHRCIAIVKDGVCTLWTRTRKLITSVPHINRAVEKLSGGEDREYDGELYCHAWVEEYGKEEAFEMVGKIVRTKEPVEGHEEIQYNIYDMPVEGPTFERRFSDVALDFERAEFYHKLKELVLVETVEIDSLEEATAYYEQCLERGYEGAMLRSRQGVYFGHVTKRSKDLLKMKQFEDAEFKIVDVIEGYKGKMKGKGIFVCLAENGKTFEVVGKGKIGTMEALAEFLQNKEKYIGRMLTVEYQGLTHANQVPRIPKGLRFREDL